MKERIRIGLPIFLAAINMRAGLVLIGPLIPILKIYFDLSNTALALLAGIPMLCFAASSLIMNYVAKLGSSNTIIRVALLVLTLGLIARAFTGLIGLYVFTLVIGIAIAVMNYEIPVWVKEYADKSAGFMTGVYVTIMGVFAAISIAITVPLADLNSLGWRMSMVPWMGFAIVTSIYWWQRVPRIRGEQSFDSTHFWRSWLFKRVESWALVLFFGFESMTFYATATWLPTLLTEKSFTLAQAALAVSLSGLIGSLIGLAAPHYIGKLVDQRLVLALVSILTAVAFLMMSLQEGSILFLWLILSNIGISIAFPMALLLSGTKAVNAEDTRTLSTMMQSIGYVLSATGPFLMGKVFEISGSWDVALHAVAIVCILQMAMALIIGKPGQIKRSAS